MAVEAEQIVASGDQIVVDADATLLVDEESPAAIPWVREAAEAAAADAEAVVVDAAAAVAVVVAAAVAVEEPEPEQKEPQAEEELADVGQALRGAACLLYTSPSPRDRQKSRMPSSA